MTDLFINLINDMKICLAIALGSGFFLGYLYTKLRTREIYKPELVSQNEKIREQNLETENLLDQNDKIESEMKLQNVELEDEALAIKKVKDEIHNFEEQKIQCSQQVDSLENLHVKKSNILDDYNKEIVATKSSFDLDDTAKIEEHKVNLNSNVNILSDTYKETSDSLTKIVNGGKDLHNEISDIKSKASSLTAALNKNKIELSDSANNLSTLKSKLQSEFDAIMQSKEDNLTMIENHKEKLLSIKKRFS